MSLLRFTSRALFASWFVAQGARNVLNPGPATEKLAPTINRVVGTAKSILPDELSSRLPETAPTWVRLTGAAQLLAGLGYTVGIARRPSAAVLAVTTGLTLPSAISGLRRDGVSKGLDQLLTVGALFGAAVLAAQDTEGRPSLSWRARSGAQQAVERVQDITDQAVSKVQEVAS
ncbi:MAG: hypothetical protein WAX29_06000 [Propionibacterium sp.]